MLELDEIFTLYAIKINHIRIWTREPGAGVKSSLFTSETERRQPVKGFIESCLTSMIKNIVSL
ncbi:MAG: hypothetical protein NZ585_02995, partial [Chloracidobacterium sp.]|nr:hypothetical protein [Chloracidobacterium sp.]